MCHYRPVRPDRPTSGGPRDSSSGPSGLRPLRSSFSFPSRGRPLPISVHESHLITRTCSIFGSVQVKASIRYHFHNLSATARRSRHARRSVRRSWFPSRLAGVRPEPGFGSADRGAGASLACRPGSSADTRDQSQRRPNGSHGPDHVNMAKEIVPPAGPAWRVPKARVVHHYGERSKRGGAPNPVPDVRAQDP